MSPEGQKELDKIRKVRGYTLPVHDTLADLNPEFLRRYGDLASHVLFGPAEGRALNRRVEIVLLVAPQQRDQQLQALPAAPETRN